MSISGSQLVVIKGSVPVSRPASSAKSRVQPETPAAPAETDYEAYALTNATILASALGFGIYVDTFV